MMALNRYTAVMHPTKLSTWFTRKRTLGYLGIIWTLSFAVTLSPMVSVFILCHFRQNSKLQNNCQFGVCCDNMLKIESEASDQSAPSAPKFNILSPITDVCGAITVVVLVACYSRLVHQLGIKSVSNKGVWQFA